MPICLKAGFPRTRLELLNYLVILNWPKRISSAWKNFFQNSLWAVTIKIKILLAAESETAAKERVSLCKRDPFDIFSVAVYDIVWIPYKTIWVDSSQIAWQISIICQPGGKHQLTFPCFCWTKFIPHQMFNSLLIVFLFVFFSLT